MRNLTKLTLSLILITLIVLGLSSPVKAQVSAPTIVVDAPSSVTVSTEFDVIISIHDIQSGWGMVFLAFEIQYDTDDLEYIECEFLGEGRPGWTGICEDALLPGLVGSLGSGSAWTENAEWLRYRFHCLRAGPTPITVSSRPGTITLEPLEDGGGQVNVFPEPVTVIVNQVAPVGGISTTVNKIEILTPYIALVGLIAAVSTVYVIQKRKD